MHKEFQFKKVFSPASVLFILVFLLIFIDNYLNLVSIPLIVYTLISTLAFCILKPVQATQYFIMLIPFANAVHIKQIAVFYFLISFFRIKNYRFRPFVILSYCAIIILQAIAGMLYESDLSTLVYLVAVMGCVVLWSSNFFEEKNTVLFLKSYIVSFTLMAVFLIALTIKNVPINQFLNGYVRLGEDSYFDNSAFHTGANGLGMMCLFCTSIIFYLVYRKRASTLSYLLVLFFLITGLMTQSRAFIIGCVFLLVYLVFFYSDSLIRSVKLMFVLTAIMTFAFLVMNHLNPGIITHLTERFLSEDITNGRDFLWSGYFESLFNAPLCLMFGAGLSTYTNILGHTVGYVASHNATQEVILAWGLSGLLFVIIWFVSMVQSRGIKMYDDKKTRALFPLFMFLFMVQSTRIFSTFNSIFLIGIALFCIIPADEYQEGNII